MDKMIRFNFKNSAGENENKVQANVHLNKITAEDKADGLVKFSKPLPITSDTLQFNGTKYDIESMDISAYKGLLTINHSDNIEDIVGKVTGIEKTKKAVTIDGIKFAVQESAMARFAKDMLLGGFITDFSIETVGPWPGDDGVFMNSELIGLSMVIVGNNKLATVNQLAEKIVNSAKADGLETTALETLKISLDKQDADMDTDSMKYKTVKNSREFPVSVKYLNGEGQETKVDLEPGQTVDVPEAEAAKVETQVAEAKKPEVEEKKTETPATAEAVAAEVNKILTPFKNKIEELETKIFDNSAKEPEFKRAVKVSTNSAKTKGDLESMDYTQRHAEQINAAWDLLKGGKADAGKKLNAINEFHVEKLQEAGVIKNSMTIADFGNFVISPELLKEIEGHRSNFQPLLSKLDYRETLSLQMAWLTRNGDVDMTEVEMCDDGADGNLKPISEYEASIRTSNLSELAAVTPVCNAATRFLAADLLGDVAAGYRNDYDRKRAQLFIARLQQAVDSTGNTTVYTTTSDVNALKAFIDTWSSLAEEIENGTFIFNHKTYGELIRRAVGAGINTDSGFGLFTTGNQPMILGRPYIVVPNELLPTLNTAETKSFTVDGVSVSITKDVFYADLSTFSGRTSGGLNFDLSTEAAYEVGEEVRSAFQRNELVLRGSFFRGGAIRDLSKVAALGAPGVS